jgi:hypothetical protein
MAFDGQLHNGKGSDSSTNDGRAPDWSSSTEDRILRRYPTIDAQTPNPLSTLTTIDRHSLQQAEWNIFAPGQPIFDRYARRMFNEAWKQDQVHAHDKGYHSAVDALITKLNADYAKIKSNHLSLHRAGLNTVEIIDSQTKPDAHGHRKPANTDDIRVYTKQLVQ